MYTSPRMLLPILICAGVQALAGSPAFVQPTGWDAYFRDPANGTQRNITTPLEKIDDRQWLGLQWTECRSPRMCIAIMPVDDKAPILADHAGASGAAVASAIGAPLQQVPVNAVEDLIGAGLFGTHHFRLFDRKAMDGIMAEKQLQASIATAQATTEAGRSGNPLEAQRQIAAGAGKAQTEAARGGLQPIIMAASTARLVGAQYLIYASITEWTPDLKKKHLGGGASGTSMLGAVGFKGTTAEVAMTFRVVDAVTGEVVELIEETGRAENWGFSLFGLSSGKSGALGAGGGLEEKTPVNYAIRACVQKGVYRIARALGTHPWRGSVIKMAEDGRVYINAGKDIGLEPGMLLDALALGDQLKDPNTGEVLDVESRPAGRISLVEVRDRVSVGTLAPTSAAAPLKPGDWVTLVSTSGH